MVEFPTILCSGGRMSIEKNIAIIKENINNVGFNDNEKFDISNIIIASKNQPIERIREVNQILKPNVFGENIAQEFRAKYDSSYTWDFIGRLQTNKIKYLVAKTRYIQSIDSRDQCVEIERICRNNNLSQGIFIEVNAGKELNKGGIFPNDVMSFYESIRDSFKFITIEGLMIVAPKKLDGYYIKDTFFHAKDLFDSLNLIDKNIKYLSMGMSEDYIEALECGSNMLRLGRAIFKD